MQLFAKWDKSWNGLDYLNFWVETCFETWSECGMCEEELRSAAVHCNYCERWQRSLAASGDCICSRLRGDKIHLKIDTSVKKKCQGNIDPAFWSTTYQRVIEEFMPVVPRRDSTPSNAHLNQFISRGCPKMTQCMSILVKKCAWTVSYALDKMIPLMTRWQLEHLSSGGTREVLCPIGVVKKRIVAGVASLVIEWKASTSNAEEETGWQFNRLLPFLGLFSGCFCHIGVGTELQ